MPLGELDGLAGPLRTAVPGHELPAQKTGMIVIAIRVSGERPGGPVSVAMCSAMSTTPV